MLIAGPLHQSVINARHTPHKTQFETKIWLQTLVYVAPAVEVPHTITRKLSTSTSLETGIVTSREGMFEGRKAMGIGMAVAVDGDSGWDGKGTGIGGDGVDRDGDGIGMKGHT